ncbi:hypothetical protein ACFL7E_03315 [Thermodesulfobacteriota bacterium]
MKKHRLSIYIDAILLLTLTAFLMVYFDIRYLFYDTIVTGGDTASWYGVAHHLAEVLLPNGRLTGWDMGNFCGYPNFNFYFLPPFLLAVIPAKLFGLPLTITLKWAIMSGLFLLPVATYLGLRAMEYRFPIPVTGAAGATVLLFNESYTMFGGNTLSTFAGEFCYMFAFSLFVFYTGAFYRGYKTGSRAVTNGILLGLIGMSHLFVFILAVILLLYAFFDKASVRYLIKVGLTAFCFMAFWILPLIAYRHPYTTPVYMIWQEFVNLRHTTAGLLACVLFIVPGLMLVALGSEKNKKRPWILAVVSFTGVFSAAYLMGQYLLLGRDLWYTGLFVPDYALSPLGRTIASALQHGVLPVSILLGLAAGVLALNVRRLGSDTFEKYCRAVWSVCVLVLIFFSLLALHMVVVRKIPDAGLRARLSNSWVPGSFYGAVVAVIGGFLLYSGRFKTLLSQAAEQVRPSRFFLWMAIVFGSVTAYFSAHFLQVPDIRFLPPLLYALFFILCTEGLGPFLIRSGMTVRSTVAVTACYLAVIAVIFGAVRSGTWYRFNNRGYESNPGYSEFEQANTYLRRSYLQNNMDPLNAPRVGYEKCDLYGPYGGDRVFESLPLFSGRQTLEGIHFAGSIASRCVAFLQTEFSRDIKTPAPKILSRIRPEALPAHFDLYNISQLVVMTDKAKQALSASPLFKKEAAFGDITIFRYTGCDGRYVDIPKIRPVLYTGKKWTDDFYAWYRDAGQTDVLLVPDRFVKNQADRAVFSGRIDAVSDFQRFRSNRLDRNNTRIDTHLTHLQIRFTTNRVGVPHLVKVSYFPNWTVRGANGAYPVSPHLMLVIPREKEVVLSFAKAPWETTGLWITCGWLLFLLGSGAVRFTGITDKWKSNKREKAQMAVERFWSIVENAAERARPWIVSLAAVASLTLITAGAVYRNTPVRTYVTGHREYKLGTVHSNKGEKLKAEKHFLKGIEIMEALLNNRSQYDHRDVINSILTTAMCHENLGDHDRAKAWYRTLLVEYPHSRYVGEGNVQIARIYMRRARSLREDGLKTISQDKRTDGERLLKEGLVLTDEGLHYYDRALQDDPYSIWANYAVKDLENEMTSIRMIKESLTKVDCDPELKRFAERLENRITEITETYSGLK